jgi:hypothetical protein
MYHCPTNAGFAIVFDEHHARTDGLSACGFAALLSYVCNGYRPCSQAQLGGTFPANTLPANHFELRAIWRFGVTKKGMAGAAAGA